MENEIIRDLLIPSNVSPSHLSAFHIFISFLHSILLGTLLSYLTFRSIMITIAPPNGAGDTKYLKKRNQAILGASNIVFLCVGLSGIMILVGNNLARALAIGATMGLIRFRVKLGNKNLGSNYLFGILVGVACGLQQFAVGWGVALIYWILQFGVYYPLRKGRQQLFEMHDE